MSDDAARLRRELTDVRQLCAALGLLAKAKRQQSGLLVLCPWHEERTPSCSLTLGADGTIRARCFGCGATGDALSLIAAVEGTDLRTEFAAVLGRAAQIAGAEQPAQKEPKARDKEPARLDAASYHALAARLVELCPFTEEPDVTAYLERRVMIIHGAKAQLAALPPPAKQSALLKELLRTFERSTLQRAGLLWKDGTLAHPHNRLVIPWRAPDGSIHALQRRRIDDQRASKYVFPPRMRPLYPFGVEYIGTSDVQEKTLVFVEGALDVLALRLLARRDGLEIVPLGLPGLDGWRSTWAEYARGRDVRIGFDGDAAGEKQIEDVARDLYAAGARSVTRWAPLKKDWAELVETGAHPMRRDPVAPDHAGCGA